MKTVLRPIAATAALVTLAGILTGCSLFGGITRDDTGQVTESSEIKSTELLTGDCFSYIGDGSDLSKVTINPCSAEHSFKVLAEGTLTTTQVDEAGGLQNAVSASCAEVFTTFKTSLAEGLKTEQSFLVSSETVDDVEVTAYSCVALDPSDAAVSGLAPEEGEAPAEGETTD